MRGSTLWFGGSGIQPRLGLATAGALGMLWIRWCYRRVWRDAARRSWLGPGLAFGVLAIGLKIIFVITLSVFPEHIPAILPTMDRAALPRAGIRDRPLAQTPIATAYRWEALPMTAPFPEDNPPSPAKIALGKRLFFDKRLSRDNQVACASCHVLSTKYAGADGLRTSVGIGGQQGERNAPTVLNAAFQSHLFWDGRARSLEAQAVGPLINPVEMGMPDGASVVDKVRSIASYAHAFAAVFSERPAITLDTLVKAIAAYERTLITPDSPYDRFVRGDRSALSAQQVRGMALFESSGCVLCHSGPNFSGASLFDVGAAFRVFPAMDEGDWVAKYALTEDRGAAQAASHNTRGVWRIPSLLNVEHTAPYFHNGAVDSLAEAVRIMAQVQLNRSLSNAPDDPHTARWIATEQRFHVASNHALSDRDVADIVAFLRSLSGDLDALQIATSAAASDADSR